MPIQLCYICSHNHKSNSSECAPSYSDCAACEKPTCRNHGRAAEDDFYCIRCLRQLGR
jgi:hypothetical protein